MADRSVYLDNNATTEPLPEVRAAISHVLSDGALNPSSVHSMGHRARQYVMKARQQVSGLLRADPEQVLFTSGATEANHLVLSNLLHGAFDGYRLITTNAEHSSIRETLPLLEHRGVELLTLPVATDGRLDPKQVRDAIDPGRTLVSVHWANNETGVLQPIEGIGEICRSSGAILHSDAVQAVGKVPIDLESVSVDLLSVSAHKVHGPQGVGALIVNGQQRLEPVFPGGGQEQGRRPGTENLPGIVGMGAAFAIRMERLEAVERHTRELRDRFEAHLRREGVAEAVAGNGAPRLPNTSNIRFRAVDGEAMLVQLSNHGICSSQGSACTNRKPEPSYVLRAMGYTEDEAFRSLRFSFSELTQVTDLEKTLAEIVRCHQRLVSVFAMQPAI